MRANSKYFGIFSLQDENKLTPGYKLKLTESYKYGQQVLYLSSFLAVDPVAQHSHVVLGATSRGRYRGIVLTGTEAVYRCGHGALKWVRQNTLWQNAYLGNHNAETQQTKQNTIKLSSNKCQHVTGH